MAKKSLNLDESTELTDVKKSAVQGVPQDPSDLYPTPTHSMVGDEVIEPAAEVRTGHMIVYRAPWYTYIGETILVLLIAAGAGVVYHLWYRQVLSVLPNTSAVCGVTANEVAQSGCSGTWASSVLAFIPLFAFASLVSLLLTRRARLAAFLFAGLAVAVAVYKNLTNELAWPSSQRLSDIFVRYNDSWNNWLWPAAIAMAVTLFFFFVLKFSGKIFTRILLGVFMFLTILSFVLVPMS